MLKNTKDDAAKTLHEIELGRISSTGSERAVLSCIFNDLGKIVETIDILQPIDFSSKYNAGIYSILYDLFVHKKVEKVDKHIIIEVAREKKIEIANSEDSDFDYLDAIASMEVEPSNIRKIAAKIKKMAIKRELYKRTTEIQKGLSIDNEESIDQIIGDVQNVFFKEIKSLTSDSTIINLTDGIYDLLQERANSPRPIAGLSTGFNRFDDSIGGGLRRGNVDIIIGRAKAGKSCFLLQVANNIAKTGVKVLYLDTEQNEMQQRFRLGAQVTGVPIQLLERGGWRSYKEYVDAVEKNKEVLSGKWPFSYEKVTGMSPSEISNIIRRWALKELRFKADGKIEDAVVILDYIKMMGKMPMEDMKEWQILGNIVTEYKDLAENLDICILSAVQANRTAINTRADEQDESLVAASDRINWFATSCSVLSKKTREELVQQGDSAGNMKLITVLGRFSEGTQGGDWLNYSFKKNSSLIFEELMTNFELAEIGKVATKSAEEVE